MHVVEQGPVAAPEVSLNHPTAATIAFRKVLLFFNILQG
jgi:hypothetical protein